MPTERLLRLRACNESLLSPSPEPDGGRRAQSAASARPFGLHASPQRAADGSGGSASARHQHAHSQPRGQQLSARGYAAARQRRERAERPASAAGRWPNRIQRDALIVDLACDTTRVAPSPSLWMLSLSAPIEALWKEGPQTGASRRALARVDAELGRLLVCFSEA